MNCLGILEQKGNGYAAEIPLKLLSETVKGGNGNGRTASYASNHRIQEG